MRVIKLNLSASSLTLAQTLTPLLYGLLGKDNANYSKASVHGRITCLSYNLRNSEFASLYRFPMQLQYTHERLQYERNSRSTVSIIVQRKESALPVFVHGDYHW